jgi:hypothetical protein
LEADVTEPSNAELVRRLEDVTRTVDRLATTLEGSYVRREVYEAKHEALRSQINSQVQDIYGDIKDIKDARASDLAFRRQIMAGVAVGIILSLVTLVVATSNFIARVG